MTKFYANVEQEITDFIDRCHNFIDSTNTLSTQSSISCLTTISSDIFSSAIEHFDVFINFLSTYTTDMLIEYDQIISIVSNCSDLVNYINTYQYLFIEYAVDDYFILDEHFNLIYEKVIQIINQMHNLSTINSEIYNLEKELRSYLPSYYLNQISFSLSNQITSTLIEQTSRLFSSSYNSLTNENDDDDDNNNCIMSSSFLFSSSPISINFDDNNITNRNHNEHYDPSGSLLQLDKINIRTTILTHSQLTPSFQFDLTDFEQIENDLNNTNDWIKIEREFYRNIISILSNEQLNIQTINPWSSETFWTLIMNFKCSDMNLKYEFILIIQWCFCLLAIQAFYRDWDLFFSKTLINTIMISRWRTVSFSNNIHISIVGHNLNQMFLRLIRITSVLQYMTILSDQSSYLNSFFTNIISSNINNLTRQIEGTFQLLIIWLHQHADTFININSLERALLICKSDQMQLSISISSLTDTLKQLKNCEQPIKLVNKLHSSCQTIVNDTMLKLYRRIQVNTTNHFNFELPPTTNEWRITYQQTSYMINACDKLLKPIISQTECLNIENKLDIYENILSAFILSWLTLLLERKYRFTDEMINFLEKDYDYLQSFLSTNICDQETVELLYKSPSIQQISIIIRLLRTGEKTGSLVHIPNQDKWLQSRKASSSLLEFFQNACCCQRRNRVTTGPS
ncbi:unnamed protein product [Adineta steineri]|uniref:Coiled-coil protein 142 C-terminal domain-containing protein n=3 Tax=Adineta steineri TaxID=433720 RepID=A0A815B7E9_9BILA|nr:unnamed protein product [Adineta steineri]